MTTVAASGNVGNVVRSAIAEQLGRTLDSFTDDSNLKDDLGADSLNLLEIVNEVEANLDIEIGKLDPGRDKADISTVGKFIGYAKRVKGVYGISE